MDLDDPDDGTPRGRAKQRSSGRGAADETAAQARLEMVEEQISRRGVRDPRVLAAMRKVPRERFVPGQTVLAAYRDGPLPIGHDQTISQPYMVAVMTEALELTGSERVLEIGTGSGYQTAILSLLAREVVTVERIQELSEEASARLSDIGYEGITFVVGDGTLGHVYLALYDRIIVTAGAPPDVPQALMEQLNDPGVLVIPCGSRTEQTLCRVRKFEGCTERSDLIGCIFVPLVGDGGWPDDDP